VHPFLDHPKTNKARMVILLVKLGLGSRKFLTQAYSLRKVHFILIP